MSVLTKSFEKRLLMKHIVFTIKGTGSFNNMPVLIGNFAKAFQQLGHKTTIVDVSLGEGELIQAIKKNCDFVVAVGNDGVTFKDQDGISIFAKVGVPFVGMLLDHPYQPFIPNIYSSLPNFILTCLDHAHIRYLDKFLGGAEIYAGRLFLPPGGCVSEVNIDEDVNERDIPVLFAASLHHNLVRPWKDRVPKVISGILDDVTDHVLANSKVSIDEALDYILEHRGFYVDIARRRRLYSLLYTVDLFVGSCRRYSAVRTLAFSGLNVYVYGRNWEKCKFASRIKIHSPVNYSELLKLTTKAQIYVNVNTNFTEGVNDRVFNAMVNGAVVCSDTNAYLRGEFENDKEILLFDWLKVEELPQRIYSVLSDNKRMSEMAINGKEKSLKKHQWTNRAEVLLDAVTLMTKQI
ncbi:MAG: glycosyltransferase family 1 protein [Negativicutes bacterium]|nr:glycosyltransferase family 1 protein [Negativicutes bacterium]